MELLLKAGADPDAQSLDHGTPLHLAALKGRSNVLEVLLSFRANPEAESHAVGQPLHCACAAGELNVLSKLLAWGVAVNMDCAVDLRLIWPDSSPAGPYDWPIESWQCQPLFVATCIGKTEAVLALLDAGASVDSVARILDGPNGNAQVGSTHCELGPANRGHSRPLLFAVLNDLPDLTRLLLK